MQAGYSIVSNSAVAEPDGFHPDSSETQSYRARRTVMNCVFNNIVLGFAFNAARSLGVLDRVNNGEAEFNLPEFCAQAKPEPLDPNKVRQMLDILTLAGILQSGTEANTYVKGPEFDTAYRERGYLFWLIDGCGDTLSRWAQFSTVGQTEAAFRSRNGAATAVSSGLIGASYVDPIMYPLIGDSEFRHVCDLGCGGAARIIRLAGEFPGIRARGIEVNANAVQLARDAIKEKNLSHRLEVVQADVTSLEQSIHVGEGVDLLLMCFMGHDLWPREKALMVFRMLRRVFHQCDRFLLADTVRGEHDTWDSIPIFSPLGFESVHAITGQSIPTRQEWERLFQESGWQLNKTVPLGVANSFVFDLRPC